MSENDAKFAYLPEHSIAISEGAVSLPKVLGWLMRDKWRELPADFR